MKPNTVLTFIILLLGSIAASAQQNYDVSLIPKELMPYASVVVRNQQINVQVKDLDDVIYHEKMAITVLNKNGDDLAHIVLNYDKLSSIRGVKGQYFDEFGKAVGKFSESNFEDEYLNDGFSLFSDERVKHYIPAITTYPYTIEYEYEIREKQSLVFPSWKPSHRYGMAIEKSAFTFACKPGFNIRYKEMNLPEKVIIGTNADGYKTYSWHIANLKANRDEPFSPEGNAYLPLVKIAPEKFMYGGITGSFSNWDELGKWTYDKLLSTRTDLPPATVQYVQNLVKDTPDPKMKARKIYEYLQESTHYISVQVGIGGYQPFSATEVDNVHYGDCKALVNYMRAMLKAGGIESWYCAVKSGPEHNISMMADFASMEQGDHVILCLPFKNDTTWLECTSQHIPFGYLGEFTDNRTVLACTPDGGKLLHTTRYTAQQSLESRKGNFTLSDAGELTGEMTTIFKGVQYENREGVVRESQTERLKSIKEHYPINNLEIEKLDLKQDKSLNPVTTEYLKLSASEYASAGSGRMSFLINPANRITHAPRDIRNRRTDVNIVRGYTDEDEIAYTLPAGYKLDRPPLSKHIEKPFGQFDVRMEIKGDKIVYKRKFQLLDGTYSKDSYQDLVDFYQEVADADAYNVELVKGN